MLNSYVHHNRDGDDGSWSTFWADIGTPPQTVRLLPSTSGNAVGPVLPQGCTPQDPSNCARLRGAVFSPNQSSTWAEIGLYQLALTEEAALGYSGNGEYGFDSVRLGLPGDGHPLVTHQVIEGFATKDFYLGTIGLSPHSINISSFNNPNASFLASLKSQGQIPSLSWSYTAGASYVQPALFGSLTLGGFDSSRFLMNNLSLGFGPDVSRDLLVEVRSISTNISAMPLLTSNIEVFLDSLVPDLWLPEDACQALALDFGLNYNASSNQYFVNQTKRNDLLQRNPQTTFQIGALNSTGETINITMPYSSFDLANGSSANDNQTRKFPLRRAENESQYTLGRVFWQNAYVIADYERSNFSVSQAVFDSGATTQQIVAIHPPGPNAPSPAPISRTLSSHGAIAGIAVGGAVLSILVGLSLRWWCQKRKANAPMQKASKAESIEQNFFKSELPAGPPRFEISSDTQIPAIRELADTYAAKSLAETHATEELEDSETLKFHRFELPQHPPAELEGSRWETNYEANA